jgi:hypothetical protein
MQGRFRPCGLTERQEAFVQCYGIIDSDTFGNATRSYMRAYSAKSPAAASTCANRLLHKVTIQAALLALKAQNGSGICSWSERLRVLNSIMDGTAQTTEVRLDRKGNPYPVTRSPTIAEMLKAVDVACEVEGLYPHRKPREASTGKALKGLLDKYTPKLSGRSAATTAEGAARKIASASGGESGKDAALKALNGIIDGRARAVRG